MVSVCVYVYIIVMGFRWHGFLPPLVPIIPRSRQVFYATSCLSSEPLQITSSSSLIAFSTVWMGPQEYIVYEFTFTSSAVPRMSCLLLWVVLEMSGRSSYSYYIVVEFLQDLFSTDRCILVQLPRSFLSISLVSDYDMNDMANHAFASRV